jgi:uncharacterized membrane protein
MFLLILGVLLFAGPHLFSLLLPSGRAALMNRFGEGPYKGLYSLASLAGLGLLGLAYWQGRAGPASLDVFYTPWDEGRHFILLLVLLGFILIFSNKSQGYITKVVRHPFSVGVALWSIAHLLANGERAVVVIFGMFLVLAVLDVVVSTARGKPGTFEPKWTHDLRGLVVGVVLYLVFAFLFHPYVLNIPVVI